jgi:hypothetical protein
MLNPVPLALGELVPQPSLFWHASTLHGQAHVSRVMIHAFRLIEATGESPFAPALWAAVYLHDIARRHDGLCHRHGADAWARLAGLPDVRELFERGGVEQSDYAAIQAAVTQHCRGEVAPAHPHRELVALLKDADALDRVRLGDLNPAFLRHRHAAGMIRFAERLFHETNRRLEPGPDYFEQLWPVAERLER